MSRIHIISDWCRKDLTQEASDNKGKFETYLYDTEGQDLTREESLKVMQTSVESRLYDLDHVALIRDAWSSGRSLVSKV